MKMTFALSAQFGYLCHLSPLLARATEIYTLSGGMPTGESALEPVRTGGKHSGLGPQKLFLFWSVIKSQWGLWEVTSPLTTASSRRWKCK